MNDAPPIKTPLTHPDHETVGHCFQGCWGVHTRIFYCDSYDPRIGFWMVELGNPENRRNVSERAIGRTFHRCDYSFSPKGYMDEAYAPIIGVNSMRWLCPRCFHANPVCPTALERVFACEKCYTTAFIVLSRSDYLATKQPTTVTVNATKPA